MPEVVETLIDLRDGRRDRDRGNVGELLVDPVTNLLRVRAAPDAHHEQGRAVPRLSIHPHESFPPHCRRRLIARAVDELYPTCYDELSLAGISARLRVVPRRDVERISNASAELAQQMVVGDQGVWRRDVSPR